MALCDVGGLPSHFTTLREKRVSPEKEGDPPQDYSTVLPSFQSGNMTTSISKVKVNLQLDV